MNIEMVSLSETCFRFHHNTIKNPKIIPSSSSSTLLVPQILHHIRRIRNIPIRFNLIINVQPSSLYPIPTSESTSESESESVTYPFAVSYLINNFGFSTESALKSFKHRQVGFKSPDNPNLVITFLKNHGFSDSDIRVMIRKAPWILSSEPHKRLLPKFQFFLSKGASSSDIVTLLTANPKILQCSLEKRIIPLFELLSRFFITNKDVIVCLIRHPYHLMHANINLMSDFGVRDTTIARLLERRPSIFSSTDLIKSLEEVKGLGFRPSMTAFGTAFLAKKCLSQKQWDDKVDTFKKWGWSVEVVFQSFRLHPSLMLASIDKINLVMNFWVYELGWSSMALAKCPLMFTYSLHRRIVPRASVLKVLLTKGLRKRDASLVTPFTYAENLFLSKFVYSFKEDSDYLLNLYEEKIKLANSKENNGIHQM